MVFLLLVSLYAGIVCLTYPLRYFKQYLGVLVVSKTQHYLGLKRSVITIIWLFNLIKSPETESLLVLNDLFRGTIWFCQRIPWYDLFGCVQKYNSMAFEPHGKSTVGQR